jgi:hypothetical protein
VVSAGDVDVDGLVSHRGDKVVLGARHTGVGAREHPARANRVERALVHRSAVDPAHEDIEALRLQSAVVARRIDPYCCGEGLNTLNTAPCGSVRTADRPTDGMSNGSTAIWPPSAAALAAVASASSTAK